MSTSVESANAVVRVQPGADVVAGIEWFTVTGAEPPQGSSMQFDDPSTTLAPPLPGVKPEQHADVKQAERHVRQTLSKTTGFVGAVLLAGHRGELVVYSQWDKTTALPTVFPDAWSIAPGVRHLARHEARLFDAFFTGPNPITEISVAETPQAHFGWFTVTPENQPKMLELARRHAPDSFNVPGLKAVNFHRGLDSRRVVNLGLWSNFDQMSELRLRPGFKEGAKYWMEVAGFRPHYFNVAAVVA